METNNNKIQAIDTLTIIILVLTLLLFASDSFGAPREIPTLVYHAGDPGALTRPRTRMVVRQAIKIINSQIPELKMVPKIVFGPDPFKRLIVPNGENQLWDEWSDWLVKRYPHYKIRHALLPAIPSSDGRWYQVGISTVGCPFSEWSPKGGGSFSCAFETRYNGKSAIGRSVRVMAHEMLHQLGATHVMALPPSLMHPGTGVWEVDEVADHIHRRTKTEVRRCLAGVFGGGL